MMIITITAWFGKTGY